MKLGWAVPAIAFVSAGIACGGAGSAGGSDASNEPDATMDAGIADAPMGDDATPPADAADGADAATDGAAPTPIALADAWVAGWYGGATARGTNRYDHTDSAYSTIWGTDPGATGFVNITDCSSFSDVLMQRAYGWTPPTTHPRPLAEDYYWAVRSADHFAAIGNVSDVQVGDTLTLLYGTLDTTTQDTGHVAWVDAAPVASSGGPAQDGLSQYVVTIIDSADGFHYAPGANQDDRYLGMIAGAQCQADADCVTAFGANAVCDDWQLNGGIAVCTYTGVGRGQLRLYVDASGAIVGYAWGPSAGSTFYPRPSPLPVMGNSFAGRDIAFGRFTAN